MADYFGTDGNDLIIGSPADDTMHSSGGSDYLNGGAGYDTAIIDYSKAGVAGESYSHILFYQSGSLDGRFNGGHGYGGTETENIESIYFTGSVASDTVYADFISDPGTWRLSLDAGGGTGFDTIQFRASNDSEAFVGSESGGVLDMGRIVLKNFEQYYLTLGRHDDNVVLGAGYDTVKAGDGNDTIDGGAGDDTIEGQGGGDHLIGGDGNDKLYAADSYGGVDTGSDIDILSGGAGNDYISIGYGDSADGGSGTDTLAIALTGGTGGANLDLSAVFAGGSVTVGGGTITGFENYSIVYGTNFDDTITTGNAAIVQSLGGNSPGIFGFDGNDVITTGTQVDTIYAGQGNDVVHSGAGNDKVYGDLGNDTLYGEAGDDLLNGGDNDDVVHGGDGNDTLQGGGGADQLYGDAGNDSLSSRGDIYTPVSTGSMLDGGDGDDWLYAGFGDTVIGGVGKDTLSLDFSGATAGMLVDLRNAFSGGTSAVGTATISGVEQYTNITGSSHDDVIFVGNGVSVSDPANQYTALGVFGGDGNDMLVGGDSADKLDGGAGDDRLVGGAGNDTYVVDSAGDLVFEDQGGGIDTVTYVGASGGYYLHANVENAALQEFMGNSDFLVGNDLANDLTGSYGDNLLLGGGGDDVVHAGYGNDSVFGEAGNDHVFGGPGIDYIVGGAGNDVLDGEIGADAIYGEAGDDILIGGSDPATDILVGGDGNDILHGDSHFGDYDLMDGGAGDDSYYVDTPADLTFEAAGGGTDTVYAFIQGAGYYLYANVENLVLQGNTPFGVGNGLDNHLTGNALGNYLLGGAGNDVLNGKGGNDVLFGESGADTFVFEHGTGGDVIGDFAAGTDKIDLAAFGFTGFAQLQAAMGQNGTDSFINLGNGDFIVLNGVAMNSLHAGDFILAGGTTVGVQDTSGGMSRDINVGDIPGQPDFNQIGALQLSVNDSHASLAWS
jgi:Ca2+-binding RTX toxin-like protein